MDEKKVAEQIEEQEEHSLAYELLKELKATCKRWFIAFLVMVVLEVGMIAGFMWYISLPVEETETQIENETGNANYIGNDLNGDLNNGKDNSQDKKESDTQ